MTKLDQVEVQLSTIDRSSSNLAQQHAQIAQAIEEIVTPALKEGYLLLDKTGRDHPGVQGVVKTVRLKNLSLKNETSVLQLVYSIVIQIAELEGRRKKLDGLCTAHRAENLQKSAAVKTFQTTFNNVRSFGVFLERLRSVVLVFALGIINAA